MIGFCGGNARMRDKFTAKYRSFLSTPIVFHVKDLAHKDGIDYLPLYLAGCL